MARRSQKTEQKLLVGMGLVAGAGWLFSKFVESLPKGSGTVVATTIYAVAALSIVVLIVRFFAGRIHAEEIRVKRADALQALLQKAEIATERQLMSLVRKRAQLVQPDAYGQPKLEKWGKEVNYFINNHIDPLLTQDERFALEQTSDEIIGLIDDKVLAAMLNQPPFPTLSDDMKPSEFETFCAEELRRAGWDARVTMQSRDQGVDVVAEKNRVRVVIQCKFYTRPVGNKAVQEVAAGRVHEQADYEIVVSNNRYTPAAEQLAATNGVLLLHHRDLQNLEDILNQKR